MQSLVKLEELIVSSNKKLRRLSDEMGQLKSLKWLHAADCKLTEIPKRYALHSKLSVEKIHSVWKVH